jgi:hypothetical protein
MALLVNDYIKQLFREAEKPHPLTQLRLGSLALAKAAQPSPTRGEGNIATSGAESRGDHKICQEND